MSQALAQIILTMVFLGAAVAFVLLEEDELAIGLVGAVLGQGVSVTINTAVNGKGSQ
jgi:hypothetical protein